MYEDLIARLRKMSKISAGLSGLLPKAGGDAMAELLEEAADALEKGRSQPMPQSPGDETKGNNRRIGGSRTCDDKEGA